VPGLVIYLHNLHMMLCGLMDAAMPTWLGDTEYCCASLLKWSVQHPELLVNF
jgi:hypothetical protein